MLDPGLLQVFRKAQKTSLLEYQNEAQNRFELGARANAFHREYDLLITPTLPIPAFTAGQNVPDNNRYESWSDWAVFCYPFNLTRQPACSIPCGFTSNGLPVGLQIIGRQFDDSTVLRAAAAFETVLPAALPIRQLNNGDTKGMN
jgi:aspartyl-tRNA(Asn)/glutamyl-tRNA(Gln) amidotransferase subunit A